jgi:hypothetical protein
MIEKQKFKVVMGSLSLSKRAEENALIYLSSDAFVATNTSRHDGLADTEMMPSLLQRIRQDDAKFDVQMILVVSFDRIGVNVKAGLAFEEQCKAQCNNSMLFLYSLKEFGKSMMDVIARLDQKTNTMQSINRHVSQMNSKGRLVESDKSKRIQDAILRSANAIRDNPSKVDSIIKSAITCGKNVLNAIDRRAVIKFGNLMKRIADEKVETEHAVAEWITYASSYAEVPAEIKSLFLERTSRGNQGELHHGVSLIQSALCIATLKQTGNDFSSIGILFDEKIDKQKIQRKALVAAMILIAQGGVETVVLSTLNRVSEYRHVNMFFIALCEAKETAIFLAQNFGQASPIFFTENTDREPSCFETARFLAEEIYERKCERQIEVKNYDDDIDDIPTELSKNPLFKHLQDDAICKLQHECLNIYRQRWSKTFLDDDEGKDGDKFIDEESSDEEWSDDEEEE